MKKTLSILLTLLLILALLPAGAMAVEASPVTQALRVDGKPVRCAAWEIEGEVWFRLRDVALALNETGSRFSVGWDAGTRTVTLATGEAYEPDGSEGASGGGAAVRSTQTFRIDGEAAELSAWNIGGHNYFRLEDLAAPLGFQADYEEASGTAIIRARVRFARTGLSRSYTDEVSGNMVNCTVIEPGSSEPWLIREEHYLSNDGLDYRETTTYGEDGRILTVETDGDGFISLLTISYDELGRETEREQVTRPDMGGESRSSQVSEYNRWGQLVRQTADGGAAVTTFAYDDGGNRIAMERVMETPVGEWIDGQYAEYDELGNLAATRSAHNGETTGSSRTTYAEGGNVVRTEQFDAMGNLTFAQELVYAEGRVVRAIQDYGAYRTVSATDYDEAGGYTTVTESPGGKTTYRADKDGKALAQEWTDGTRSRVTVWSYDEEGRLTRIETGDPGAEPEHVTEIVYDESGRLLRSVYAQGGYREEEVFEYDLEARKMSHTKTTTYPEAAELQLSSGSLTLRVGEMNILTAVFLPGNARRGAVSWTSSDDSIVTVDVRGIVTAVGPGEAAVTAESEGGLTAECRVTVTEE